ncbi:unnamed protein product [Ceutorhynchus assimilis]|uniref:CHK kinase-like domain-containing protein n=1 Tax=Ceutorhynchus assimilis TaxID=467358 RepID=A0A9N9MQ45_9CUCU|nr:unnamed protein product [Ceutorhynchus assimilis]
MFEGLKILISAEISAAMKNSDVKISSDVEVIANKLLSLNLFEVDRSAALKEVKLLKQSICTINGKFAAIIYNVLREIFAKTNEKSRQEKFDHLMDACYEEILYNFELQNGGEFIKKPNFNIQVKLLLPLVKFELLLKYVDNNNNNSTEVKELINNIQHYFNYPRLNQEDIYVIIENKIGINKEFNLISYEIVPLDTKSGLMGEYFQLFINLENEKLIFFAKFLNFNTEMTESLLKMGPSKKEEFFYTVFLPKLKELGYGELLDFAPNCYFSRVDDVIVLDDMTQEGFIGLTPNSKLDYETLKVSVEKIAKFHACGFILEEHLKQSGQSLYEYYKEYLQEVVFEPESVFYKTSVPHNEKVFMYLATTKFPDVCAKYSGDILKEKYANGWRLFTEKIRKSETFKNGICHGDLHIGNLLFHSKSENTALIDFQNLRYCPPAHDLLLFLYCTTLKETLDTYQNELIAYYHSELTKHLRKFNLEIENIFPKEEFHQSIHYMKSQCIFHAFFYNLVQMIEPTKRKELLKNKENFSKYTADESSGAELGWEDEAYRRVIKGFMELIIELCDDGHI